MVILVGFRIIEMSNVVYSHCFVGDILVMRGSLGPLSIAPLGCLFLPSGNKQWVSLLKAHRHIPSLASPSSSLAGLDP